MNTRDMAKAYIVGGSIAVSDRNRQPEKKAAA